MWTTGISAPSQCSTGSAGWACSLPFLFITRMLQPHHFAFFFYLLPLFLNLLLVFSSPYIHPIQLALDTALRPWIPVVTIPSTLHKGMDISPRVLEKFQLS